MTTQLQKTHRWAERISRSGGVTPNPSDQPVFFFDGEFRTWGQVEQRALLNRAIAAHISSSQLR
jgi:hypothetical protein